MIIAPSTATAAQVVRAVLRRPHGAYTATDVAAIADAYAATCAAGGLDLAMVAAQMIHETDNLSSWWAARPRRNPAGIGVTARESLGRPQSGSWAERGALWVEGCSFASWAQDAIPAHVGRLLAYALAPGQGTTLQQRLIAQALGYRALPAGFRGVAAATGWQALNGRWAVPGGDYDQRIARIAETIRRA